MSKEKLDNLIDKVIGKVGPLRVPAYWMNKLLKDIGVWVSKTEIEIAKVNTRVNETRDGIPTKVSQLENDAEFASKYNLPHGCDVFFVPGEDFIALDPFIKSVYKGYIERGYVRPTVTNGDAYYEFLCVLDENSVLGYYSGAYEPFASQELALGVYKITLEFISTGCVFHRLEKLDTIGGLSLFTYRNSEDNPTILLDRFSGDGIYYNGTALTSNKHTPDGFGEHVYVDFGMRRDLDTVNQLIHVSSTLKWIEAQFSFKPNLLTANFTGLERMAPDAFRDCSNLQTVSLGSKLKIIPNYAFSGCSSLNGITIPESVTKIGDGAFACCNSITNITIPDSVTEIGDRAFKDCSSLSEIVLSNSLTTLPEYSLHGLNVRSLYLPPSIKYIEGNNALSDSINEVYISDLAAFIDINVYNKFLGSFYDLYLNGEIASELDIVSQTRVSLAVQLNKCKSLKRVYIEAPQFSSMNSYTPGFCYCPQLETFKLNVPSATAINTQSSMFMGCERLEKFEGPYASSDSKCLIIRSKIVSFAPYGIREYTAVDSATEIGRRCFAGCKELERLNLQGSITSIGSDFIKDSTNLEFVNFENHTSIPRLETSRSVPESCVFIVPDALHSAWKLATNWSALADKIIKKSDWDAQQTTE